MDPGLTVDLMFDQTGILPPEGLIIEAVTPLTPAGDLDAASLSRLLARVSAVADGILVGGPAAGEVSALPPEVRLELLARKLDEEKGRLPVFCGITGSTPEESRALALAVPEVMSQQGYQGQVFLAIAPVVPQQPGAAPGLPGVSWRRVPRPWSC